MKIIGTTIKAGRYKVTIKNQFGRWLVGQNATIGWCVIDRATNEISTVHQERAHAEKRANNLLIRDQDQARQTASPASFVVEVCDPRSYEWHRVLTSADRDRAIDVAAQFIAGGQGARVIEAA
jgi:hypothetical protein